MKERNYFIIITILEQQLTIYHAGFKLTDPSTTAFQVLGLQA